MTWRHVACIAAALALPVVCKFSMTCSDPSFDKLIGLSSIVVASVMGNAMSGGGKKDPP